VEAATKASTVRTVRIFIDRDMRDTPAKRDPALRGDPKLEPVACRVRAKAREETPKAEALRRPQRGDVR